MTQSTFRFVRSLPIILSALLIAGACVGPTRVQAGVPTHKEMIKAAIDEHILPRLDEFNKSAQLLPEAVSNDCLNGDAKPVQQLQDAFADTVASWAGVATDLVGPARKRDRATRIAFLPDPRGIVRRQMRRVLAQQDSGLLSAKAISEQSVAIQGLPALGILLFPSRVKLSPEQNRFRCWLAEAIARNISVQALEMRKDWEGPSGWRNLMLSPGPDNDLYKTDAEAASEIVKSYLAAVKSIRESQIIVWQDAVQAGKKWAGLPFERAGLSKQYLMAELASIRQLHEVLRLDEFVSVVESEESGSKSMSGWIRNVFVSMDREVQQVALPKDMASAGTVETAPLRRLKFYTDEINQIVGQKIAPAAGLFIGFNELDGD